MAAGHCRPEIADAVARQLRTLDYTPSFLRSHPLSFQLADRIAGLMPDGLKHVFFVNSGSESVETAMKIALAYHYVRGKAQRNMFVSRERAYHGVNFGGVALSGMVRNREMFGPGLPGVAHMRHTWLPENRYTVEVLQFSVCLDAFPAASAPGVSAPAASGVDPALTIVLLRHAAAACRASGTRWLAGEIPELNPRYDSDGRTARLAARIAHEMLVLSRPAAQETA